MTEKQARILIILFAALLVILAAVNFPYVHNNEPRPKIRIISVSTFSEVFEDVYIIDYAMDGVYYSVRLPITKSPQGYLDYLSRIGDLEE